DVGETLGAGEGAAWIDDRDQMAGQRRHAGERLRDMYRADDQHAQARIEDFDKNLALAGHHRVVFVAIPAALDRSRDDIRHGKISRNFSALDQTLLTDLEVGGERGGLAGTA